MIGIFSKTASKSNVTQLMSKGSQPPHTAFADCINFLSNPNKLKISMRGRLLLCVHPRCSLAHADLSQLVLLCQYCGHRKRIGTRLK